MIDPTNIDLSKLAAELREHENLWVAISAKNAIVAAGATYRATIEQVPAPDQVVMLKVTPAEYSLSPSAK